MPLRALCLTELGLKDMDRGLLGRRELDTKAAAEIDEPVIDPIEGGLRLIRLLARVSSSSNNS